MNPTNAYAYGALVKMAEHNIDPVEFVRAAVQTRDPVALKVANAIVEYEKVATGRSSILSGAQDLLERGAGRVAGGVARGAVGLGQTALNYPKTTAGLLGAGALAGGTGATGLGMAAHDYVMSPAETWENQLRALASNLPGVNLEQQSRLGAGLEQAGDYLTGLGQPG